MKLTFGTRTDLQVIGTNPECADMSNPRGEIIGEVHYVVAETPNGEISKTDGDCIKWSTESKEVTI